MAAAIQNSLSVAVAAAAAARLPSSSLASPRFPLLRLATTNITPIVSWCSRRTKSRSSSSRRLVYESPSAKYIGEDYLVKKVTAKEVEEMIRGERSVPLVVDFYATWCGPCILMAQELEMLAVEYEKTVLFVKVDTDDEYEFARDMQVRGLPTLYFISPDPSKDAIRTEGLVPTEMIKNIIDNEL